MNGHFAKTILFCSLAACALQFISYYQFYRVYRAGIDRYIAGTRDLVSVMDSQTAANLARRNTQAGQPTPIASLVFVGDIMLARAVGDVITRNNDPNFPFVRSAPAIAAADLAFANLESPISDRGQNQGSIYSFRADPTVVGGLLLSGFDVFSLANNHIWDYGAAALTDTVSRLTKAGIKTIGAGTDEQQANEPAFFEIKGMKIAFLGYTTLLPATLEAQGSHPGTSHPTIAAITQSIKNLRPRADVVIVSLHWGQEYAPIPTPDQENFARALVDAGADLVVGHHSHVAQKVERYKNSWIAYSLGNFIFDQSFSKETTEGLLLTAVLDSRTKKIESVSKKTFPINESYQPEL